MPVWHASTAALRAAGDLMLVGVVQEQHPDRAALFAQWQGFDWPILWDPFGLTGSKAVPNVWALDEHGVVRAVDPRPEALAEVFPERDRQAPDGSVGPAPWVTRAALEGGDDARATAVARALWGATDGLDGVVATFADLAAEDARAADLFRLGVALRLRHDRGAGRAGDLQGALDAWGRALALDPSQYVWRRRLQQYGPRLDKPYPFYDWVERARAELHQRGLAPVALRTPLSGAETAERGPAPASAAGALEPDPTRGLPVAQPGWLDLESALAFDTSPPGPGGSASGRVVRVHLSFRPTAGVHWNDEAGPAQVWIDAPEGWSVDRALVPAAGERGERVFDFELAPPEGSSRALVRGYLVFGACTDDDGRCRFARRDLEFEVAFPDGPSGR